MSDLMETMYCSNCEILMPCHCDSCIITGGSDDMIPMNLKEFLDYQRDWNESLQLASWECVTKKLYKHLVKKHKDMYEKSEFLYLEEEDVYVYDPDGDYLEMLWGEDYGY